MRLSQTAALKRPTKGAMTGFFRRAHQQSVSKNEMRKQFCVSTDETYHPEHHSHSLLSAKSEQK